YTFDFQSNDGDKDYLTGVVNQASKLAARVNPNAANYGQQARDAKKIYNNCIAGVLSEQLWQHYLNKGGSYVSAPESNSSFNQIDLVTKSGKTIEVRSSFPRNGIPFAICNSTWEFDVLGPYSNSYKPGEIQKDFYVRTLFHLPQIGTYNFDNGRSIPKIKKLEESLVENGFEVFLTGGATWAMMANREVSITKNLIPEDETNIQRIGAKSDYLDYQLDAVSAVVDVFEGQPVGSGGIGTSFRQEGASLEFTERGVGNQLVLSEEQLLENTRKVQERNNISLSTKLERTKFDKESGKGQVALNLTVEMETGTGKTYTYLRTIYRLNEQYGWKKFVVVVPSVAIREGTLKNLEVTHEHFQTLFGRVPINFSVYDSGRLGALRNYATSDALQVLVINIDSFTKDNNIINTKRESGVRPVEYIQGVRPVVIVDEPQ
nr:hypothetical protein [Tanacetum cinerariifolium]